MARRTSFVRASRRQTAHPLSAWPRWRGQARSLRKILDPARGGGGATRGERGKGCEGGGNPGGHLKVAFNQTKHPRLFPGCANLPAAGGPPCHFFSAEKKAGFKK